MKDIINDGRSTTTILASLLGVEVPDDCDIQFVVRTQDVTRPPVGGRVTVRRGIVGESELRAAPMAGTSATSWPGASPRRAVASNA
jgi:hypothetical protein